MPLRGLAIDGTQPRKESVSLILESIETSKTEIQKGKIVKKIEQNI